MRTLRIATTGTVRVKPTVAQRVVAAVTRTAAPAKPPVQIPSPPSGALADAVKTWREIFRKGGRS